MKIYYWNVHPNFGDLINPWLWPKIFPEISFGEHPKTVDGVEDVGSDTLLVGIGTLLNERFPQSTRSIVLGSGVGYGEPPKLGSETKIYCVRGPLSAQKLSLPESYGIIDPGILLRKYFSASENKVHKFSYMPQISSVIKCPDSWHSACQYLGYGYIDPRDSVEESVKKISETGILLTESMHGAIVAEALRVPWIPIVTRSEILSFKWQDWCQSIGIEYKPVRILPLVESHNKSIARRLRSMVTYPVSISQLKFASRGRPSLADENVIDDRIARLEEVFDRFRSDELSEQ